jgi:hypothetical protein
MIDQLPPETDQLGQPLAEYKARRFNIIAGPILAAIGLLLVVIGCEMSQRLVQLAVLGLILLPFGLILMLHGHTQRGLRVVLFTDGLLYQQAQKTQIVRWQDIAYIHKVRLQNSNHFIYAGKTFSYTIQTNAPLQIVLDNKLERFEELGDKVQEAVARRADTQAPFS